jgi:hypothetical protein
MKMWWKIVLGIVAAVALVVIGMSAGWLLWGRQVWAGGMMGRAASRWNEDDCQAWGMMGRGRGMMERGPGMMGGGSWAGNCGMDQAYASPGAAPIGIDDAHESIERYIDGWDTELEIAEVMEFEENFYAIVRERDTGTGAMELLIDKNTGAVSPEMGPNMMWNAKYGMHRGGGMMDQWRSENSLSEEQAIEIAQEWLDANKPGVTTEAHADPFYGYYTIHTVEDGEIEGMLSVHGTTGQVWYHTWHGAFLQMIESDDGHD